MSESPAPDDALLTTLETTTGLPVPDELRAEVLLHARALRRAHDVVEQWYDDHEAT